MKYLHILLFLIVIPITIAGQPTDTYRIQRSNMVDNQLIRRGITDSDVLSVMWSTPRHQFVPRNLREQAYSDGPLPIGLDQTISQPYIVALMTELLHPFPEAKVLEIGTGSGYQAAVLSPLVQEVFTIEILPGLAERAATLLDSLGYSNITVRAGDGYQGWPEEAPFDRIIVTAAPEEIPPKLIEQLRPGGIMVLPCGPQWWSQELLVVSKDRKGNISKERILAVRFVPMVHETD